MHYLLNNPRLFLPGSALPCPARPCPALPCLLRPDLPCSVTSRSAIPCSALSYPAQPNTLPFPVLSCPVLPCPVLPCPALPRPNLSCPDLPCHDVPCPAQHCPVLPCSFMSRPALYPSLPYLALPSDPLHTIRRRLPPCLGTYHPPSSAHAVPSDLPLSCPPSYRLLRLSSTLQLSTQHQSFCVVSQSVPCLACCALHPARDMTLTWLLFARFWWCPGLYSGSSFLVIPTLCLVPCPSACPPLILGPILLCPAISFTPPYPTLAPALSSTITCPSSSSSLSYLLSSVLSIPLF